jgi:hypothetical protein
MDNSSLQLVKKRLWTDCERCSIQDHTAQIHYYIIMLYSALDHLLLLSSISYVPTLF